MLILIKFLTLLYLPLLPISMTQKLENKITKNDMTVSWEQQGDKISFFVNAPTNGWVAIGFNEASTLKDTYLIMGRVSHHKTEIVEHYVLKPGFYKPLKELKCPESVSDIIGKEQNRSAQIQFSLPIKALSSFQKDLKKGHEYHLLMAFSNHDDFKHHSVMRTSLKIKL